MMLFIQNRIGTYIFSCFKTLGKNADKGNKVTTSYTVIILQLLQLQLQPPGIVDIYQIGADCQKKSSPVSLLREEQNNYFVF